ncbi:MAG: flavin reductase family protein [Chromatocurvus sp.]
MTINTRELRNTLGQFATGVCLVTINGTDGRALALTINSFASVSLDPPLVLWSLQRDADTYTQFVNASEYAISVLTSAQQNHSNRYAMKDGHELDASHYTLGDNGAPVITGALAGFECSLDAVHPGGDHVILVGRVTRFWRGAPGEPLVFFGGGYRQLDQGGAA